jgi:hypothetical protein
VSDAPERVDPRLRRHLLVLVALTAVAVVGIGLVVTGHRSSRATTTTLGPTTSVPGRTLRSLGRFADDGALRDEVRHLDPTTLRAPEGGTTTTVTSSTAPPSLAAVTAGTLTRCTPVLTNTSERPLGSVVSSASALVGATPVVVVTFHLPATKTQHAGVRAIAAEAVTCRIRFAVDY